MKTWGRRKQSTVRNGRVRFSNWWGWEDRGRQGGRRKYSFHLHFEAPGTACLPGLLQGCLPASHRGFSSSQVGLNLRQQLWKALPKVSFSAHNSVFPFTHSLWAQRRCFLLLGVPRAASQLPWAPEKFFCLFLGTKTLPPSYQSSKT